MNAAQCFPSTVPVVLGSDLTRSSDTSLLHACFWPRVELGSEPAVQGWLLPGHTRPWSTWGRALQEWELRAPDGGWTDGWMDMGTKGSQLTARVSPRGWGGQPRVLCREQEVILGPPPQPCSCAGGLARAASSLPRASHPKLLEAARAVWPLSCLGFLPLMGQRPSKGQTWPCTGGGDREHRPGRPHLQCRRTVNRWAGGPPRGEGGARDPKREHSLGTEFG